MAIGESSPSRALVIPYFLREFSARKRENLSGSSDRVTHEFMLVSRLIILRPMMMSLLSPVMSSW